MSIRRRSCRAGSVRRLLGPGGLLRIDALRTRAAAGRGAAASTPATPDASVVVRAVAMPDGPAPRFAVVLDLPIRRAGRAACARTRASSCAASAPMRAQRAAIRPQRRRPRRTREAQPAIRHLNRRRCPSGSCRRGSCSRSSPTGRPAAAAWRRWSFGMSIARDLRPAVAARACSGRHDAGRCSCLIVVVGVAVPDHPVRRAGHGARAGAVDHRIGARAVHRHRARAAGRLLAPDRGAGAGSARRAGRLVQHDDEPRSRRLLAEMAEKKRLEEELRIARQIQMSLLPQSPPCGMPGLADDGALHPGARSRRRLLRLPAARRPPPRAPDRRRVRQGHVGGASTWRS